MTVALTWCPKELTYTDVKDILDALAWRFYGAHGAYWTNVVYGGYEELRSVANVAFVKAYESYDGSSSFKAWVHTKVVHALMSHARACRRKHYKRKEVAGIDLNKVPTKEAPKFDLWALVSSLGEDAAEVVRLAVVDTPADVYLSMAQRGRRTPRCFRSCLREYLMDVGWPAEKVAAAFREVKEALS